MVRPRHSPAPHTRTRTRTQTLTVTLSLTLSLTLSQSRYAISKGQIGCAMLLLDAGASVTQVTLTKP